MIRSFAHIDVYLNAGKKNIQEQIIIKLLLFLFSLFKIVIFKSKIGKTIENKQKNNLR